MRLCLLFLLCLLRLLNPWHPSAARHLAAALTFLALGLGVAAPALAQDPAAAATSGSDAAQGFASVWRMRGAVSATAADGRRVRLLREGDRVFVGERVSAAASSEAVLRTEDAGLLAVRPGGEFLAERYAAEGRATDHLSLRIFMGSVRLITGWIGHSNRAGYRVLTPSATIGIRGTDHEPFVMTVELADRSAQPAGTYNKVNRGGTTLDMNGNRIDIDPGKVGFARAGHAPVARSLLTILLPVLLDRVPDFFVPGEFDAELDQLSLRSEDDSRRLLDERRQTTGTVGAAGPTPAASADQTAGAVPLATLPPANTRTGPGGTNICGANAVARNWLTQFDRAIIRRDAPAVLQLFAVDAQINAIVRAQDGSTSTILVDHAAFVQSTVNAIAGLADYHQRRVTVEGWPQVAGGCNRIAVRSVVIEQGNQAGIPFRFEATEDYLLERQRGKWLAVQAVSTQR